MTFSQDELAAIIGTKELERIYALRQLQQAQARISELEDKYEPKVDKPHLAAVDANS